MNRLWQRMCIIPCFLQVNANSVTLIYIVRLKSLFIFFTVKRVTDMTPLRKHAYSNILKNSPPKRESFQIKSLIFFIFLLKT